MTRDHDEPTVDEHISLMDQLGQSCNGHPERVDDALPQLLELARDQHRPEVLEAFADALGQMWDPRCLPPLLELVDHAHRDVRLAAARALGGSMCSHEPEAGLDALVQLTKDADAEIRDWATFSLGQRDADSPDIRAALWERVDDSGGNTAGEALVGLARRGDQAVRDRILDALETDPGNLVVEAAAELGDPTFHPALVRLRDRGWAANDPRPGVLDEALAACDPGR